MKRGNRNSRILILLTLIITGEVIFFLPFVLVRIFRPSYLSVFNISNTELGFYFSIYGLVAMISYALGGPLADRFKPSRLMASALWLTSSGGILICIIQKAWVLPLVYGLWGLSTILLFWSSLLRATREWGGELMQGKAYAFLEAGRGAVAAAIGSISYFLYATNSDTENSVIPQKTQDDAFFLVVFLVSGFTALAGALAFRFIPNQKIISKKVSPSIIMKRIRALLALPGIWLLSILIVCAYTAYKFTDDISLYANEVLGYSQASAVGIGTLFLWLRSLAALSIGFVSDRYDKSILLSLLFGMVILGSISLGYGLSNSVLIFMVLTFAAFGIYSIRALYFAVQKEAGIPLIYSGTAIGLISFIGFTPDVFAGPLMGLILDQNPGDKGHHILFTFLAFIAFIGLAASMSFMKIKSPGKTGTSS